jgi:uncharacterized protein (DUF1684 family)
MLNNSLVTAGQPPGTRSLLTCALFPAAVSRHHAFMHRAILILLLGLALAGCKSDEERRPTKDSPPPEWLAWKAQRRESVAGPSGWTTLIARQWLLEGQNFVGSDPTNHAMLPPERAPARIGAFIRSGRSVRFEAAPGIIVTIDGRPVESADLQSDASNAPTMLLVGALSFVVIERGERIGLRVRDPEAPARLHFRGLDCFPYDPAWRIDGRFEPFVAPRTLRVEDVIGGTQEFRSPGAVVFHQGAREHRLDVVEEPGAAEYFVLFRDRTAGSSTYGAGRFLYVAKPDSSGRVTIDFNRAYTPPCGFTSFATCPLPPRQNWLPFAVRAGERMPPKSD